MSNLTNDLQYAVLGVIAYHAEGKVLCHLLDDDIFTGNSRVIFTRLKEYWHECGKPPETANFEFITRDLVSGNTADLYEAIIRKIYAAKKVNPKLVVQRASDFVKAQKYKVIAEETLAALEAGGVDSVDEVANILSRSRDINAVSFDKGVTLTPETVDWALEDARAELIKTGIEPLDNKGICPCKKELFLVMAPPKGGKSWSLCHMGAVAMSQGMKVLHITLEMSERIVMRNRYISNIFGVPLARMNYTVNSFKKDEYGNFVDLENVAMAATECIEDEKTIKSIKRRVKKLNKKFNNLIVKGFPSGALTIEKFEGYLVQLAEIEGIRPDMIIVDYADLFQLPADENRRHALDSLFVNLRRIADERNCAVVTASQVNRTGAASKKIGSIHAAESFSKVMTADIVVSLNTTDIEKKRGLTRLSVVASRNSKDGFDVLISGNLVKGQFCVESCEMSPKYIEVLKSAESPA